jgi:hypothetical protein
MGVTERFFLNQNITGSLLFYPKLSVFLFRSGFVSDAAKEDASASITP